MEDNIENKTEKDYAGIIKEEKEVLLDTVKELEEIKGRILFALSDIDQIQNKEDALNWIDRHKDIDDEFKYVELK